jgi:hypothetical protein
MMTLQAGVLCKYKHSVLYNLFFIIFIVCHENLVKKHLKLYTGPAQASCDAGNFGKIWSACGQHKNKHKE